MESQKRENECKSLRHTHCECGEKTKIGEKFCFGCLLDRCSICYIGLNRGRGRTIRSRVCNTCLDKG